MGSILHSTLGLVEGKDRSKFLINHEDYYRVPVQLKLKYYRLD